MHVIVVANSGRVPHFFVADAVAVAALRPITEEPPFTLVEPRHRGHDGNSYIFEQARGSHGLKEPSRSVTAVNADEFGNVSMRESLARHRRGKVGIDLFGYHHFCVIDRPCGLSEPLMFQDAIDTVN